MFNVYIKNSRVKCLEHRAFQETGPSLLSEEFHIRQFKHERRYFRTDLDSQEDRLPNVATAMSCLLFASLPEEGNIVVSTRTIAEPANSFG